MLADLDLLLTAVFCTPTISCPSWPGTPVEMTDAEVVTLAVAQAIMGVPRDDRFLRLAAKSLSACSRSCPTAGIPQAPRPIDRDDRVWLIGVFASQSSGFHHNLVLLDPTPVECARALETVRRSQLSDAAGL